MTWHIAFLAVSALCGVGLVALSSLAVWLLLAGPHLVVEDQRGRGIDAVMDEGMVAVDDAGMMTRLQTWPGTDPDDGDPPVPDPQLHVPYGPGLVLVHRTCLLNRMHACDYCAQVVGRTKAVTL